MINVLLIDDDEFACAFLKNNIDASGRYKCFLATIKIEDIEDCIKSNNVEILVLDICSSMNECGLIIAKKCKQILPKLKIILMTKYPEYSYLLRAKNTKADSFWYKVAKADELIDIMDKTLNGMRVYPDKILSVKIGNVLSDELSVKEVEVLRELVKGETDADIARCIHMSIRSVKGYIQSMRSKTGFRNRTELAVQARALGLVMNSKEY